MVTMADPPQKLTPQQQACVELLLDGLSNREIAERLGVELNTVKAHLLTARATLGGGGENARWWVKMAHALGYARGRSTHPLE